jgi:hypothetical protein
MPTCKRDDAELYFEEYGAGFPVLLFSPGSVWASSLNHSHYLQTPPTSIIQSTSSLFIRAKETNVF